MNFLAHLWLAEQAQVPLAGAILGDVVRGRLEGRFPAELEWSIRLHRRIDVLTDRHALVVQARERFAPGARRYAGIVLDVLFDHALARQWPQFCAEPLEQFAQRAGERIEAAAVWFQAAGEPAPPARLFAALLLSYADEAGIEKAFQRMARRLSRPQELLAATVDWRTHAAGLAGDVTVLLPELAAAGKDYVEELRGGPRLGQ